MPLASGKGTIDEACTQLTGKIGEKIVLRRFELVNKTPEQQFAHYEHFNGKTGVLCVLNNKVEEQVAKDIAMHAAAMAPKYLSAKEVDPA
jgi:elongation factor Ts